MYLTLIMVKFSCPSCDDFVYDRLLNNSVSSVVIKEFLFYIRNIQTRGLIEFKAIHPLCQYLHRLAIVGILGKEREPGVGKLGWQGNFDTGFERNTVISFKIPCASFLSFFKKVTVY